MRLPSPIAFLFLCLFLFSLASSSPSNQTTTLPVPFHFGSGIAKLSVPVPSQSPPPPHASPDHVPAASSVVSSWSSSGLLSIDAGADASSAFSELADDVAHTMEAHRASYRPYDRCSWPGAAGIWDALPVECLNVGTVLRTGGYAVGADGVHRKRRGTRRGDALKMLRADVGTRLGFPRLLGDCNLNREDAVWVEVGVLKGDFAGHLIETGPGFRGRYIGIDVWAPIDMYTGREDASQVNKELAIARTQHHPGAELWQMLSLEGATKMADGSVDFVYIDATHLYETVLEDLRAFWPKLRVGGIMAGDDYFNGFVHLAGYSFGVKDAVDQFAAEVKHRVYLTNPEDGPGGLPNWYMLKCAE
ncbi:hypothetical protein TeGR_g2455 [Tetraparma gracilis]|uniref:Methyltransferase domain-containing protein n=1 Tax=Tetraparma gracilis TaxID=2962635 RepID=A0ABQ6N835_9STRA|nr:hypothetical protein TeGR_g2455 [Tetraparma gracilis]